MSTKTTIINYFCLLFFINQWKYPIYSKILKCEQNIENQTPLHSQFISNYTSYLMCSSNNLLHKKEIRFK